MTFPSRWVQFWTWIPREPLNVPSIDPPGTTRYWNTMRWMTVTGPDSLASPGFRNAIIIDYAIKLENAYNFAGLSIANTNWLVMHSFEAGVYYYDIIQFYNTVPQLPFLPDQVSVCIAFSDGAPGKRHTGHTFLSNVPGLLISGDYLNALGILVYEDLLSGLITPFTTSASTIQPCLPSYANATLQPIQSFSVRKKLSMVLRRSRSPAVGFPPPYRPPFPPPP